jgi:hypothetical protein
MSSSLGGSVEDRQADVRTLAAALLLLSAMLGFVAACGNGDLVFPGQVAPTQTAVFTATPTP